MPKPKTKQKKACSNCKYLYTKYGKKGECYLKLKQIKKKKICKDYQEGFPFVPTFKGKKAKNIPFDPENQQAFMFAAEKHALIVVWTRDHDGYGYWRIKLVGIDENDEIVGRIYENDKEDLAFYGEVAVVGARKNDLYRSFGFEDDDEKDEEGNLINKPKEILVLPRRFD